MTVNVGNAFMTLVPKLGDTSSVESELDRKGMSDGGKWGGKFGAAAKVAVAAAAAGLGKMVGDSVANFAEYEQLKGGAELMFGDAYDYIAEKAKNAYATVQMSQNDYLTQVNGLATGLKTALGGDAQAAAELADKVVTAEADIVAATGASAEAVQNGFNGILRGNYSMLDNLQIGIKGTKEGMQEVIDAVNEANGTSYNIENAAEAQQALIDYVDMVGMADYASNEGASTIQGSISAMQGAWSNFLTALADPDADLSKTTDGLVSSLMTVVSNVGEKLPQVLEGLASSLTTAVPQLFKQLVGVVLKMLPTLVSAVSGLIVGLAQAIPQVIPPILNAIPTVIDSLVDALAECIPALIEGALQMVMAIVDNLPRIINSLVAKMPEIITKLINALVKCIPQLVQAGFKLFTSLVKNMPTIISTIVSKLPALISALVGGIGRAVSQFVSAGGNLVVGLWNGFTTKFKNWLMGKVSALIDLLPNAVKKVLGIHSPSRVFAELGSYSAEGFEQGFTNRWGRTTGRVNGLMDFRSTRAAGGMYGGGVVINLNYEAGADANQMVMDIARGLKQYNMIGA